MRIIGIDPGGTTGIARFQIPDEGPAELVLHKMVPNGVGGILSLAHDLKGEVLAIEAFEQGDYTVDPNIDALKIIWALEGYDQSAHDLTGRPFWNTVTLVQRAGPKDQIPNRLLQRSGYHPARGQVGGGHSRDAIRVGLWYIVNRLKHRPTMLRIWPRDDSGES